MRLIWKYYWNSNTSGSSYGNHPKIFFPNTVHQRSELVSCFAVTLIGLWNNTKHVTLSIENIVLHVKSFLINPWQSHPYTYVFNNLNTIVISIQIYFLLKLFIWCRLLYITILVNKILRCMLCCYFCKWSVMHYFVDQSTLPIEHCQSFNNVQNKDHSLSFFHSISFYLSLFQRRWKP